MNNKKDYYKTLGVSERATSDEIKKAFRRLAKKYHPDATGGDKAKEARFKEINEAYEVVGDEKKRGEYDALRKSPFGGMGGGFPTGAGPFSRGGPFRGSGRNVQINIEDLFGGREAPGGAGGGGGGGGFADLFSEFFGGGAKGAPTRGADITSRLEVDLPTAAFGGEAPISIDGKRLTVKIPAAIEDGQTIRIAGKGASGPGGPGDLLLEVHVRPHPHLRRVGHDLEADMPLSVDTAVIGGKVDVSTLEGKVQVSVPPETSSGTRLRLRGKGLPRRDGTRGDLYAVAQIKIPKEIPPRAKELIVEFARLTKK